MYDAQQFANFNDDGMQPLHVACRHNMKFIVTFMVKNKIVTGTELTEGGDSPLHVAAQYNSTDVVRYLLDIVPSNLLWTSNNKGSYLLSPLTNLTLRTLAIPYRRIGR